MLSSLFKALSNFAAKPSTREAATKFVHTFSKHPAKHASKVVQAAFKVGVETGKKFQKIK